MSEKPYYERADAKQIIFLENTHDFPNGEVWVTWQIWILDGDKLKRANAQIEEFDDGVFRLVLDSGDYGTSIILNTGHLSTIVEKLKDLNSGKHKKQDN